MRPESHAGEPERQAVQGIDRRRQCGGAFGHPEAGSGKDVDGGHAGGQEQVQERDVGVEGGGVGEDRADGQQVGKAPAAGVVAQALELFLERSFGQPVHEDGVRLEGLGQGDVKVFVDVEAQHGAGAAVQVREEGRGQEQGAGNQDDGLRSGWPRQPPAVSSNRPGADGDAQIDEQIQRVGADDQHGRADQGDQH